MPFIRCTLRCPEPDAARQALADLRARAAQWSRRPGVDPMGPPGRETLELLRGDEPVAAQIVLTLLPRPGPQERGAGQ